MYLQTIIKELKKGINTKIFAKSHSKLNEKEGVIGEKRLKLLKKAYDILIDFMLPDPYRFAMFLTDTNKGSDEEWISKSLMK